MLGLWFPGCFGLAWGWYNIGLRRGGFRGWRSGRLVGLGVGGFWWVWWCCLWVGVNDDAFLMLVFACLFRWV